jgi:hypothetical protein
MAFRSASAAAAASSNSSTFTAPTGIQDGDILVIALHYDNAPGTITWPSGFTQFVSYIYNGSTKNVRAAWKVASSESGSYVVSTTNTIYRSGVMGAWSGRSAAQSMSAQTSGTGNANAISTPVTISLTGITAAANDDVIYFPVWSPQSSGFGTWTFTPPTNYTTAGSNLTALYGLSAMAYRDDVSAGATGTLASTVGGSTSPAEGYGGFVVALAAEPLEQEAFAFGDDNGNEAAHTLGSQNANVATATAQTKTLRLLINATGDPQSTAYTLYAQKNGTGGYSAVSVGSGTSPALSFGAAGTLAYSGAGGAAGSVAPTYPTGITTNSALILVVGQKPSSANGGTVTTPSGWTLQGSLTGANDGDTGGYTTTLGADTGNVNVYVYTKDVVSGTESGTLSVTLGTNDVSWANIYRIQASDLATLSYQCGTGKDTTGGSVSIATGNMDVAAGDHILAGMVIPTDVTTPAQFSAEALAQTGTTFGTINELEEPDSATGSDIGGFLIEAAVSSGSGSGAVTMTATAGGTTTNVRGPGFVLRVRASPIVYDVYVTNSSNVAAGGEATTARLTPSSGKTTSNFTTGRRWDDENGSDSIDIGNNFYTEVEWVIRNDMTTGFVEFRVYAGSSALTTYTVTPKWTIGTVTTSYPFIGYKVAPLLLH